MSEHEGNNEHHKVVTETATTIQTTENWIPDSNGGGKWANSVRTTTETTRKVSFE